MWFAGERFWVLVSLLPRRPLLGRYAFQCTVVPQSGGRAFGGSNYVGVITPVLHRPQKRMQWIEGLRETK